MERQAERPLMPIHQLTFEPKIGGRVDIGWIGTKKGIEWTIPYDVNN